MGKLPEEVLLGMIANAGGGGGGGTSNYNALENKPSIEGNELVGNKTAAQLGLVAAENGKSLSTNDYDNNEKQKNADNATAVSAIKGDIASAFDDTASYAVDDYVLKDGVLYKCTTDHTGAWDANDFTATTISDEIADVADAVDGIKDGTDINSFGDVETALAGKQNTITAGLYIQKSGDTISVKRDISENVDEVLTLTHDTSGGTNKINAVLTVSGETIDSETFTTAGGTFHDLVQISFDIRAVRFMFKYLVASKTQSAGYENYVYNEYSDTFVETIGAESKLVIKSELDDAMGTKQDTLTFDDVPTANSNNPVKSGGVKSAIDAAVASAYHHAGTKTCAELVAGLLVATNEGNVYNMTDSGTTTADFIEGAGQPIKAGDNVGVAKVSDGVYKFDLLSGFVDTSNFVQKSVTAGLLKNDGTVNDEIEDDVSTLKSGLTDLSDHVDGSATTYPYADVITINDAVPANLADCSVKVEPVQDLHGYDKPWVGGAGKNKLPMTVDAIKAASGGTWTGNKRTFNGVEFEILTDESNNVIGISAKGTASLEIFFTIAELTIGSDEYILNGCPAGGSWLSYFMYWHGTSDPKDFGSGVTINDPNVAGSVQIHIASGYVIDKVFYPMIRLATETDATFAPYTNICPISGHTEASVQRDGRNLFPSTMTWELGAYGNAGNKVNTADRVRTSSGIYLLANTQYTLSLDSTHHLQKICQYDSNNKLISNIYTATFTTAPNCSHISITANTTNTNVECQLEIGDTAHAYEPYKGQQYTLALGDTIYGGTVDFKTGVMTVDRGFKEYEGAVSENWRIEKVLTDVVRAVIPLTAHTTVLNMCNCLPYNTSYEGEFEHFYIYNNILYLFFYKSRGISDVETLKAFLQDNHVQICYRMKATTIQLSPQQIQLLQGTNTLYASTGDISVSVNGVSGAIGQLQEQVNDHEERIEALESGGTVKELRYTGTGTTPNTIDFGDDTPKRIMCIIPDPDEEFLLSNYEAIGEISWGMMLAFSYWSTQSGGVPTTNNGGTNMIRTTFSGNTMTLNAGNAAQIANYSGQKYLLKYEV